MKVYPTAGSERNFTPTGAPGTAVSQRSIQLADGTSAIIPIEFSSRGETSKRGIRRVVFRCETTLSGQWIDSRNGGTGVVGEIPISVHLVATAPQGVMQLTPSDATTGPRALVSEMTKTLIAILTGGSASAESSLDETSGPLVSALCGSPTLDVVGGEYGDASEG